MSHLFRLCAKVMERGVSSCYRQIILKKKKQSSYNSIPEYSIYRFAFEIMQTTKLMSRIQVECLRIHRD